MTMKLWQVYYPNYRMILVIAETQCRALELAVDKYGFPANRVRLTAEVLCEDLTSEFVSRDIDVT